MRKSVIDIGTNTILMLIAEYEPKKHVINTILDLQRIPRLGKGVDKNRIIIPESFEKAISILNEYKQISYENNSNVIIAAATSFLRDSDNRSEFIDFIKDKTGIKIEMLSGSDEAKWTFIGGTYDKLNNTNKELRFTTIDIGGGSTEITSGDFPKQNTKESLKNILIKGKSFNIGSVRINEKFFTYKPPLKKEIENAENFILSHFTSFVKSYQSEKSKLIGLAGTITTLGAVKLRSKQFIPGKVDNLELTIQDVNELIDIFSSKTYDELIKLGNYMEGRADIILSGTLILKCFMNKFEFERLEISTKGLRYGVFLREMLNE